MWNICILLLYPYLPFPVLNDNAKRPKIGSKRTHLEINTFENKIYDNVGKEDVKCDSNRKRKHETGVKVLYAIEVKLV